MSYKDEIRSPEWIKCANAIKERAGWACKACGAKQSASSELTIHHIYYMSKMKMWDHPDAIMECLCWDCHKKRQKLQQKILCACASALKGIPTDYLNMEWFCEAFPGALARYAAGKKSPPQTKPVVILDYDNLRSEIANGIIDAPRLWAAVVREFSGKYPLQGAYIEEMTLESVCAESKKLLLSAPIESRMAVHSLERPSTRAQLELIISAYMGERFTIGISIQEGAA